MKMKTNYAEDVLQYLKKNEGGDLLPSFFRHFSLRSFLRSFLRSLVIQLFYPEGCFGDVPSDIRWG